MNVDDSAHAVVHDYPGGSESLAPRLGMSPAVLNSKVNPNTSTHKLGLVEAVRISALTEDDRILRAFAQQCGCIVLRAPDANDAAASDMAVLELVAAVGGSQGDLFGSIHRGLADGVLTEAEFALIRTAGTAAMEKVAALLRRLDGMVER
ncbi:phage regulatory CII family protein [Stenotrophomonas sp.]|uniref:phage regulatory CII family protein n=1 Tax=Stenotrophomonas sp. TaxID=69392 RepID=UPI0028A94CAF|nr:phage regulatory CII family protein [Stenotrophomonas sp.]